MIDSPPPHVDAIIQEVCQAMALPMMQDRLKAGLPKPSEEELRHISRTMIACATCAVAAALFRLPDWNEEQVEAAFQWMKKETNKARAIGKS